jgi:hypothetical protein
MGRPWFLLICFAAWTLMSTEANAQSMDGTRQGTVHFPISCRSAQDKFDRAVALLHNFFYPETVKAFRAISEEYPSCAMAYWGLAMSQRPNPLVPPFPVANLKAGWEAVEAGQTCANPNTTRGRISCSDGGVLSGL